MTLLMAVLATAGVAAAFAMGAYRLGHAEGVEMARLLGEIALDRERGRCRRDQLGALYGAEEIPRPSRRGLRRMKPPRKMRFSISN